MRLAEKLDWKGLTLRSVYWRELFQRVVALYPPSGKWKFIRNHLKNTKHLVLVRGPE
jgi:hypothetical protein